MSVFEEIDRLEWLHVEKVLKTKQALRLLGWILRPLSVAGMWRARRHTKNGTMRVFAPTAEELLTAYAKEYAGRPRTPRKAKAA